MQFMEKRSYKGDDGTEYQGLPYTRHKVIDQHGNLLEVRADMHQRDWQGFELARGAIIVNEEPLGSKDVEKHGRLVQVGPETIGRRLAELQPEIARRRAKQAEEAEKVRDQHPLARAKRRAAAEVYEMSRAMAPSADMSAALARISAQLEALTAKNAELEAKLAERTAPRK